MLDELIKEAWMKGIQHIEEPFAMMGLLAIHPFILHVLLDQGIFAHELTDLLSRELIIVWHCNGADICSSEDLLVSCKDLLNEDLVEVSLRRHIVLEPIMEKIW